MWEDEAKTDPYLGCITPTDPVLGAQAEELVHQLMQVLICHAYALPEVLAHPYWY